MIRTESAPVSLALTDQISLTGSALSLPEGLSYDIYPAPAMEAAQ